MAIREKPITRVRKTPSVYIDFSREPTPSTRPPSTVSEIQQELDVALSYGPGVLDGLVKLGQAPRFSSVYAFNLGGHKAVLKTGPSVHHSEAETMKLLKKFTDIPVPSVLNTSRDPQTGHPRIFMEYIDGEPLSSAWDRLSPDGRQAVIDQMLHYTTQLRTLRRMSFIGSVDSSGVKDAFFSNPSNAGPFLHEDQFVSALARSLRARGEDQWTEVVIGLLNSLPAHSRDFVLTHGELDPRNILVQGSKVAAILDWSEAGYYPEYWEFVKAHFSDVESCFVRDNAISRVLSKAYPLELSVMLHARAIIW